MTRKSRREIERHVAALEDGDDDPYAEYPILNDLALLWRHEWERVAWDDNLRRQVDSGEIYCLPVSDRTTNDPEK